jgi:hypothetical protein
VTFPCTFVLYPTLVHPLHFSPFYFSPYLMVISAGLKILYSFLYRQYINHIYLYLCLLIGWKSSKKLLNPRLFPVTFQCGTFLPFLTSCYFAVLASAFFFIHEHPARLLSSITDKTVKWALPGSEQLRLIPSSDLYICVTLRTISNIFQSHLENERK